MLALQVATTPPFTLKDISELVAAAVVFGTVVIGGYRLGGVTTRMEFTERAAVDAVKDVLAKLDKIGEFIDHSMTFRQEWGVRAARWDACDEEHDSRLNEHAKVLELIRDRTHQLGQSIQNAVNSHALLEQRVGQIDRRSGESDRRHSE